MRRRACVRLSSMTFSKSSCGPDGSNSVGKRFSNRGDTAASRKMIVVGVVKDVRHYGLAADDRRTVQIDDRGR